MAFPVWTPRNHVSIIAGMCASAQAIDRGRPFMSTSTTGFPVDATASTRAFWIPGRSSVDRLAASPLIALDSPTARTTASASFAASTARAIPLLSAPSIVQPLA